MEYKVKLVVPENDSFIEVWQILGTEKYVGRYTLSGEWVHICDPFGYCEMDHPFKNDVVFIVCDKTGQDLFRSRNGDGTAHFPTLQQEASYQFRMWCIYHNDGKDPRDQNHNLKEWLLTFKDPKLYAAASDYPENWVMHSDVIKEETLHRFRHLGETHAIKKYTCKHRDCGVKWIEYYSAGFFMCAEFDANNVGTMYTEREAEKIIADAIQSNFPGAKSVIFVETFRAFGNPDKAFHREKYMSISNAADFLAGRDLHRTRIDAIADRERMQSHFFSNMKAAAEAYPDLDPRHIYRGT